MAGPPAAASGPPDSRAGGGGGWGGGARGPPASCGGDCRDPGGALAVPGSQQGLRQVGCGSLLAVSLLLSVEVGVVVPAGGDSSLLLLWRVMVVVAAAGAGACELSWEGWATHRPCGASPCQGTVPLPFPPSTPGLDPSRARLGSSSGAEPSRGPWLHLYLQYRSPTIHALHPPSHPPSHHRCPPALPSPPTPSPITHAFPPLFSPAPLPPPRRLFLDELRVLDHLEALRRIFFCGAGDWAGAWVRALSQHADSLKPLSPGEADRMLQATLRVGASGGGWSARVRG